MSARAPARSHRPGRPKPHVAAGRPTPRAGSARKRGGRPKLRVVGAPAPRRLPFLLVSFVVVGLLIAAVAGVQALVSQSSYRVEDLSRRIHELEERQGELRLEVAELSSPQGIAKEAQRLGLELPGPPIVLKVPSRTGSRARPEPGSSP